MRRIDASGANLFGSDLGGYRFLDILLGELPSDIDLDPVQCIHASDQISRGMEMRHDAIRSVATREKTDSVRLHGARGVEHRELTGGAVDSGVVLVECRTARYAVGVPTRLRRIRGKVIDVFAVLEFFSQRGPARPPPPRRRRKLRDDGAPDKLQPAHLGRVGALVR